MDSQLIKLIKYWWVEKVIPVVANLESKQSGVDLGTV